MPVTWAFMTAAPPGTLLAQAQPISWVFASPSPASTYTASPSWLTV